jgi:hypothetical protein
MPAMEAVAMRVIDGTAARRKTPLEEAYEVFRLERQGNLVSIRTLDLLRPPRRSLPRLAL